MMKKNYFLSCLSVILLIVSNNSNGAIITITAFGGGPGVENFSPANPTMVCGDTILWVNNDGVHTTASTTIPAGAPTWDSPIPATGSFMYVTSVPGTYSYTCHPSIGGHMPAGFVVTGSCGAAIDENEKENQLSVYPNPTTRTLNVEVSGADLFVLYTATGKQLTTSKLSGGDLPTEIDVHDLAPGIYVYKIFSEGVLVESKKWIKK